MGGGYVQVCKTGAKERKPGRSENLPHAATMKRDHRYEDIEESGDAFVPMLAGLQARSLKPQRLAETSIVAIPLQ